MMDSNLQKEESTIPFFPDHVSTEFKVVIGISVIAVLLGLVGLVYPVGLGEPADPLNTPAHVKPEWYFLGLYQVLKYVPKTFGAVLPVLGMILITLWPFLDKNKNKSKRDVKIRAGFVAFFMIVLIILTIWGEVS